MDERDLLRLKLADYMKYMGIELNRSGFALCPLHPDKETKSFGIVKGRPTQYHCFGCGAHGDIFQLAHELEGLPLNGLEFYDVTITTLAKRFGIPLQPKTYSDTAVKNNKMRAVFVFIKNKLMIDDMVLKYMEDRGFNKDILKRFGIGRINFDKLKSSLRKEFTEEVLGDTNVMHEELFKDRIIFTLFDEYGSPIGFTGRLPEYTPESPRAKYVNSITNPFFDKSKYLYNLHFAKEHEWTYVVEGQTDVLRLFVNGIHNVVATSGTSATEHHINILRSKFKRVVWAYDGDSAGLRKVDDLRKILPRSASIIIPDNHDPDSFVRNYGINAFKKLEELDNLAWTILRTEYNQPEKQAIPFIKRIAEGDVIKHDGYLAKLAVSSGIEYITLRESLRNHLNTKSWDMLDTIMKSKDKFEGHISINIHVEHK